MVSFVDTFIACQVDSVRNLPCICGVNDMPGALCKVKLMAEHDLTHVLLGKFNQHNIASDLVFAPRQSNSCTLQSVRILLEFALSHNLTSLVIDNCTSHADDIYRIVLKQMYEESGQKQPLDLYFTTSERDFVHPDEIASRVKEIETNGTKYTINIVNPLDMSKLDSSDPIKRILCYLKDQSIYPYVHFI